MNPFAWLGIVVILVFLAWDWAVKKRRVRARPAVGDEEFLESFRSSGEPAPDTQILEARRWVARELGLPESKIRPEDRLSELRDRYCLVVSGHLALSDLLDDLDLGGQVAQEADHLETVGDLIAAFLRSERPARPAQPSPS